MWDDSAWPVFDGPFVAFGAWVAPASCGVHKRGRCRGGEGCRTRTSEHLPSLIHGAWGLETAGFRAGQHGPNMCACMRSYERAVWVCARRSRHLRSADELAASHGRRVLACAASKWEQRCPRGGGERAGCGAWGERTADRETEREGPRERRAEKWRGGAGVSTQRTRRGRGKAREAQERQVPAKRRTSSAGPRNGVGGGGGGGELWRMG